MKLNYNLTEAERKKLVLAISGELNAPLNYLGAPTFAYKVGGYHIDKNGMVTGKDNLDLEDALHRQGFDADGNTREYDEPDTYESGLGGMGAVDIPNTLTIQMPLDGFTPEKLDNLTKLVNAKAYLLKAALGADDLPVQHTVNTLAFPWFAFTDDSDTIEAYTLLISRLCKTAKEKKRVTAQASEAENPKYAMRCFLLSLGFIGNEYKSARKILLSRLSGNTAWKSGKKMEVTNDGISE